MTSLITETWFVVQRRAVRTSSAGSSRSEPDIFSKHSSGLCRSYKQKRCRHWQLGYKFHFLGQRLLFSFHFRRLVVFGVGSAAFETSRTPLEALQTQNRDSSVPFERRSLQPADLSTGRLDSQVDSIQFAHPDHVLALLHSDRQLGQKWFGACGHERRPGHKSPAHDRHGKETLLVFQRTLSELVFPRQSWHSVRPVLEIWRQWRLCLQKKYLQGDEHCYEICNCLHSRWCVCSVSLVVKRVIIDFTWGILFCWLTAISHTGRVSLMHSVSMISKYGSLLSPCSAFRKRFTFSGGFGLNFTAFMIN